jgi:phage I-like protein
MKTMVDLAFLMSESATAENWIQIMKAGEFDHPGFGKLKITPADLHQFKENFDKKVRGVDLAVDVAHEPDKGAVAWFKELKVDGDKLMAKVAWTEEGATLIKSGKYRYFSPEFTFSYTDAESGKQFKDVLLGGAITNRPFLKNMDPIEFSEDDSYATIWMAEDESYDPDGDDDDDTSTDPNKNPDWMIDVLAGITPWPTSKAQQDKLTKVGATKEAVDAAYKTRQEQIKKQGDDLAGAKKKGKVSMSEPSEEDKAKKAQMARSKSSGIGVKEDGSVTKPSEYKDIPDGQFADPTNYAYPIDSEHVLAAYRYFAKPSNQKSYTPEEVKIIAKRIVNALPDKYKEEATKTFKLSDDKSQTGDETDPPNPIDDVTAGKFTDPAQHKNPKKEGSTKMSEETIKLQERIKMLEDENRRIKMGEKVKGYLFNENTKKGKILPAQQDKVLELLMGMDDTQVAKFEEVINALPDAISFNDERGHGFSGGSKDRDTLVAEKADTLLSEGKAKDYRTAILMAEKEIPEVIQ